MKGIFIFPSKFLKFGDLLGEWNLSTNAIFQHNISKIMPAWPKKTGTWFVNILDNEEIIIVLANPV